MRVKDAVGRFGEDLACRVLEDDGYQILDRNWRCPEGELDIVALTGDELVVVEVKTRSSAAFGSPAEAVDRRKAARLRRVAARWIDAHRAAHRDGGHTWRTVRIDVIAIVRCPRGAAAPQVDHLIGAV